MPPPRRDPLAVLLRDGARAGRITHVERLPPRAGRSAEWPNWADPAVLASLRARGVHRPWLHQVAAAEHAWAGRHVVLSTGTASGKSLAYQLPVLSRLAADPGARALYLAPTKALAADQLAGLLALCPPGVRPAPYDGDTPGPERDWARAHATLLLSNPDMVHRALLPGHARWRSFLRGLQFVVIDECHAYRGVFGSHVAQVLRRLRRVCAAYGAQPTFVLASATVAAPAITAGQLTGLIMEKICVDDSPRAGTSLVFYEPPLRGDGPGPDGAGASGAGASGDAARRSATTEAAELLVELVVAGHPTLAFTRTRAGAETLAQLAREGLTRTDRALAGRVAAYRGGYLAEERRDLETRLRSGELLGLATTSALELGVDISGVDAVVLAGFPGTLASLWQQAGRAGRAGTDSVAVLIARDDPLDSYLVHHPEAVTGRPVEATVLDPTNPHVLGPHLECAAAELPLTDRDLPAFGPGAAAVLADLTAAGRLRRRPTGWFWTRPGERPEVDLRGSTEGQLMLVELDTGRLLGTVDADRAGSTVHAGAVYLHQGASFLVHSLDLGAGVALLEAGDPGYTTTARQTTQVQVEEVLERRTSGPVGWDFAQVCVTRQVVGYLRRASSTGRILGEEALELPPRALSTRAVVATVGAAALDTAPRAFGSPGAAHAAEHAALGLLPLFASCDRRDIGGFSTGGHPDAGVTVVVYDGAPGGAGFAERGWRRGHQWLRAARDAVRSCGCTAGCPSCVHSASCGSGNEPLDKRGAVDLLTTLVQSVDETPEPPS